MYINRTDRVNMRDFLMDEDWEQLVADGLIADSDRLIADLEKSIAEYV